MPICDTVSYMKTSVLTLRLDPELERDLDALATATGQSRSEIVREALRRRVAVLRFEQARRAVLPFAEARGYLTDDDVFRDVT
jgi:predicted transcriptional regulator